MKLFDEASIASESKLVSYYLMKFSVKNFVKLICMLFFMEDIKN